MGLQGSRPGPTALWVSSNRKTWQDLGQARTPLADVVLRTISAIEDRSQDDLVSMVRSQYQVMYPQLQPLRGPSAAPNGVARGCLCLPGSLQPRAMRGIQQSPGTASFELPASSLPHARAWALVCNGRTAQLLVWPETGPVQLRGLGLALPPLRRPGSTLTEGSCLGRVHVCSLSTGRPAPGSVYLWSHLSCQASGGLTPCPLPRSHSAPHTSQAGKSSCDPAPGLWS